MKVRCHVADIDVDGHVLLNGSSKNWDRVGGCGPYSCGSGQDKMVVVVNTIMNPSNA
jgi:hypothetical protein